MILLLLIFSTLAEQVIIATSLPSTEETERTSESSTIGVGKLDQLLDNDESTEASPREVSPEELRSPDTKIDDETQEITAYAGTGTEQDPFTAGTAAELQAVTETIRDDPGVGPYHVNLIADIIIRTNVPSGGLLVPDKFNLYKDTIIDGQGYHLLAPNEGTLPSSFFSVQTNNINVTFNNINFGSSQLVDQNGITYGRKCRYGMIDHSHNNSLIYNLTMENISFYSNRGTDSSDLIWHGMNSKSYFRFKGSNQINVLTNNADSYLTNSANIIIEENSSTYIETGTGYAVFNNHDNYAPGFNAVILLEIKNNASLEIVTGKEYVGAAIYSINIMVEEGAQLSVYRLHPGSQELFMLEGMPDPFTYINIGKDAKVSFESQSDLNASLLRIYSNQLEYFRMKSEDGVIMVPVHGVAPYINRQDGVFGQIGGYQVSSLDISGNIAVQEVPVQEFSLKSVIYYGSQVKEVLYHRQFVIKDAKSIPEIDVGISNITTSINTVEPAGRPLTKYELKLSDRRLWTSSTSNRSINTISSQQEINNATLATNGVLAIESSTTESSWQTEELPAGTYYAYVRVAGIIEEDPELQKFTSQSLWHEFLVEVPKNPISVEVPLEKFFNVRESGEFDESAKALPIINHSNFPIDFKVTDVVEESIDSPVTLVNNHVPGAEKHLQLYLAATNGQHTGPLVVGSNDGNAIEVLPFLEDPLKLYLRGHYSGPIDGRHDVRYRFTYQLTPR